MVKIIESISTGVPKVLTEVITLGRTLHKRAADVLAYFDRPGTSNGPLEAINGRLEYLRGSALGFRNLTSTPFGLVRTGGDQERRHREVTTSDKARHLEDACDTDVPQPDNPL